MGHRLWRWALDNRATVYPKCTSSQWLVLLVLCDYVREGPGGTRLRPDPVDERGWVCFPGLDELCEKTGMEKRTLQDALTKLTRHGYITKKQRGTKKSNLYTILDPLADAREEKKLRSALRGMSALGDLRDDALIELAAAARDKGQPVVEVVRDRYGHWKPADAEMAAYAVLADWVWQRRGPGDTSDDEDVVEAELMEDDEAA